MPKRIQQTEKKAHLYMWSSFAVFLSLISFSGLFSSAYEPLKNNFTLIHFVLEFVSIAVSAIIASNGWVAFTHTLAMNRLLFSSAFVAVAFFDLMHILTFSGAVTFIETDASSLTIWFWVLGRLAQSASLAFIVFSTDRGTAPRSTRWLTYGCSLLLAVLISIMVILYSGSWPALVQYGHPTKVKNAAEYLFIAIHLLMLVKSAIVYRKQQRIELLLIMLSSYSLIFSSWLMTLYQSPYDYLSFGGHLFKVLGYFFLVNIIFKVNIEHPFKQVEEFSRRNQLLLDSVGEGIYGLDSDGRTIFINKSALRMLGYTEKEVMGRKLHYLIHYKKENGFPYSPKECPIRQTSLDGINRKQESFFWRKDGTGFPVELDARALLQDDEIIGTVTTFIDLTEARKLQKLELEKQAVDVELELAASVQQSLLPKFNHIPPGVDLGGISVPYRKLSGDFYKAVFQGSQLVFGVADICGKGVPAAIEMAMMTYSMEQFNHLREEPHHVLESLNRFAFKYMSDSSFVTMFFGNYDIRTSTFSYSNAGHEPALLFRERTGEFLELTTNNPILGVMECALYETKHIHIESGDLLLLYTDGLTENRSSSAPDDNQALRRLLLNSDRTLPARELSKRLFQAMNHSGRPVTDDQTLLIFKKL
ncbi:SpoIIE family protein phosphatase [Pseudobacillus badius]|uniref:SpoIIE family protein phosphatase n=1 Tax=Bacillus badius TaxID=1455 RepID=UPI0024A28E73|nr:SpoIIE family protein phosphatase [Bacillus badius]MED0665420.1 SpoIIE family protein phosphatase [Bacillus badius]GLY11605.1 hypothetical protein Bbad01_28210 [Bacillus badius]